MPAKRANSLKTDGKDALRLRVSMFLVRGWNQLGFRPCRIRHILDPHTSSYHIQPHPIFYSA